MKCAECGNNIKNYLGFYNGKRFCSKTCQDKFKRKEKLKTTKLKRFILTKNGYVEINILST